MDVVYRQCCGLDVHKKMVVACLLSVDERGQRQKEIRVFTTMTRELLALADWLAAAECTQVAMESTGVFWQPIFALLEGQCEVLLANAQHLKAVPGHKTDIKDAEWIADLLQHGLLRPSFIPPLAQRQLRELTRYRSTLVAERARLVNRRHKLLEDTNLKLTAVVTNVTGVSARAMLEALLAGETDPAALAGLARGKLRKKRAHLEQALEGRLQAHHRFLLTTQLAHLDDLDASIAACDQEIVQALSRDAAPAEPDQSAQAAAQEPSSEEREVSSLPSDSSAAEAEAAPDPIAGPPSYLQAIQLLDTIPGVNQRLAEIILAEIGADMRRFPSARHLASWVGIWEDEPSKRRQTVEREDSPGRSLVTAGARCGRRTARCVPRRPI
jgi:transposase